MDYVVLPGYAPLTADGVAHGLPLTLALFDAVEKSKTFELVEVGSVAHAGHTGEVLIVELSCDAVPSRNPVGIEYRERFAIVVRSYSLIPEVYPLRAGFPDVWHRNLPLAGYPPDLCLYYEPVRATRRTFTAENFLKRVEWWVQATANETLHAADQPVEQLFFRTRYEIVLPFDFEARYEAGESFCFWRMVTRANDATTLMGMFATPDKASKEAEPFSEFVLVNVPPRVHGAVTLAPKTLGDLHDWLLAQGLDLRALLTERIQEKVGPGGEPKNTGPKSLTLLLRMPVTREAESVIESVQHRAFFVPEQFLEVGKLLGALIEHGGRSYRSIGLLGDVAAEEWRDVVVESTEVLFQNDQEAARRQSGLRDAGPKGALLGAGALGSAIYDIWVRSGWGAWTPVDKDHVKPHNITRHTATYMEVGMTKVDTVIQHATEIAVGQTHLAGLDVDVVESSDTRLEELLTTSELVVDVTTTLDYPRKASVNAKYARHISAFISPSGADGVLLAEDAQRKTTLLSLEAQYYRAMISSEWGAEHLRNNYGTFWSGAGCRDISVALPYSRVLAHAATQSEQIMMLSNQDAAAIRVWVRDTGTGSTQLQTVSVDEQVTYPLGPFTGYMDKGLEAKLFQMRDNALPSETGGILLGYWDFNINALVLVDALPAPSDSVSDRESFVRGTDGLLDALVEVQRRTAGIVGYVGEWHSHPEGVRAQPSSDDLVQLVTLAKRMAEDGMPVVSMIIGEGEIQLMQGQAT
jgi:integrative and conjugative element protein (TIGR02256 family)